MKKIILVTGAHRSGSTWTGKVIGKSAQVKYIHEPFNIAKKRSHSPLKFWFQYVSNAHSEAKQEAVKSYLKSFSSPSAIKNKDLKSIKGLYSYVLELKRRLKKRTLIKDPLAIMSAEWIYKTFPSDIIILIRHPAAFIASIKLKDWAFDFMELHHQPKLIEDLIPQYKNDIERYAHTKQPIVKQGILLWNIIYDVVWNYQQTYKDEWIFIKHEDLSTNTMGEFSSIFKTLDIPLTKEVKNYIIESTTAENESLHSRDSKSNIETWKHRLTEEEIETIKKDTFKVWNHFYSESDW